jgi:hypothetical protein
MPAMKDVPGTTRAGAASFHFCTLLGVAKYHGRDVQPLHLGKHFLYVLPTLRWVKPGRGLLLDPSVKRFF